MYLSLSLSLSYIIGITDSIFPEADKVLNNSRYQAALSFVAKRKNMDRYHSTMDFLFCELFPEFQSLCFAFYRDGGDQLIDLLTPEEIASYELELIRALNFAEEWMTLCELDDTVRKPSSWTHFRTAVSC